MKNKYMITLINDDFIFIELTEEEFKTLINQCRTFSTLTVYDIDNKIHFINSKHIVQIYEREV